MKLRLMQQRHMTQQHDFTMVNMHGSTSGMTINASHYAATAPLVIHLTTKEYTMTTDLTRTFIDDLDDLPAEIPGASDLEPGRLAWLHGVNAGGAKTAGCFYGRDTAFVDPPGKPWVLDERHEGELGFSAPELRLAFIGNRSQWFIPGQDKGDMPEWLTTYQDGAKKLTEYLILVDGIAEPMVLSVSGKYKAGPVMEILSNYRRGALAQAMRKYKRTLPAWAFWLPIANLRDKSGKTIYLTAKDGDGKEYGSVVTPPALVAAPLPVTKQQLLYGAELWQQYQEWMRFKRTPRDTTETYTISSAPQLPPGRNAPQPIEDSEFAPF
jgi:hypothetical protein